MSLKITAFLILTLAGSAQAASTTCLLTTENGTQQNSNVIFLQDVFVPPDSDLATYSFQSTVLDTEVGVSVTDEIYSAHLKSGNRIVIQEFQDSVDLRLDINANKAVLLHCPYND